MLKQCEDLADVNAGPQRSDWQNGYSAACRELADNVRLMPSTPAQSVLVEASIKYMVDRFLSWKLPNNFNPDNGISFDPIANKGHAFESKREPVGTNLLSADQATEMVRYMVEGLPVSESQPTDRLLADIENREARRQEILDWLQEKIGTAWECDQCGYQTYHSSSNECAECGKDFPTLHLLAFKLHASHTEALSHAPSQPAPVVAEDETGWLIEDASSPIYAPSYWCGLHGWTTDNLKAVRFAREDDAKAQACVLGPADSFRIKEHGWG